MTKIYDALRKFERDADARPIAPPAVTEFAAPTLATPAPTPAPVPVTEAPASLPARALPRIRLPQLVALPTDWMISLHRQLTSTVAEDATPVLQVASPRGGDGVSSVAQNLATTAAGLLARRVLLINPVADIPATAGATPLNLAQVFCDTGATDGAVFPTDHPMLSVAWLRGLPNGLPVTDMQAMFTRLRDMFDLILIDSGSVATWRTESALLRATDGVVLVVRSGRSRWSGIEDTMNDIQGMGGHVAGIVLNQHRRIIPRLFSRR